VKADARSGRAPAFNFRRFHFEDWPLIEMSSLPASPK
jgi:hypothetical protein